MFLPFLLPAFNLCFLHLFLQWTELYRSTLKIYWQKLSDETCVIFLYLSYCKKKKKVSAHNSPLTNTFTNLNWCMHRHWHWHSRHNQTLLSCVFNQKWRLVKWEDKRTLWQNSYLKSSLKVSNLHSFTRLSLVTVARVPGPVRQALLSQKNPKLL